MEEKNNIIVSYIEDKISELEKASMYVPNENKEKLIMAFKNRNEDIDVIKTRIDTIFNNSVATYNANLEKMGFSYDDIIKVYDKVNKMNKTSAKVYLRGGIVPYLLLGESSFRKHSNLDLICNKKDIKPGNYIFYANQIENEFIRDNLSVLYEYGVPSSAIRKLADKIPSDIDEDKVIEYIKNNELINKSDLISYEKEKLYENI